MHRAIACLSFGALFLLGSLSSVCLADAARPRRSILVLPGEFEPVERLLIAWDNALGPYLADIVSASWGEVAITIVLDPKSSAEELSEHLWSVGVDPAWLDILRVPVAGMWIRDFGPLIVRGQQGSRHIVDFHYMADAEDDRIPLTMRDKRWPHWPVHRISLEVEGGNIQADGMGRCITTAGYEHPDKSNKVDVDSLRRTLRDKLGCHTLILLPPLKTEPTAHVDMFATITGPGEVIVGSYDRLLDPDNAARLDRSAKILAAHGFVVRRIPMPDHSDGIFRSYTNALSVNRVVLVPVYPEDTTGEAQALAVFRQAYPGRQIIPIVATEIIELYGAVHCTTMTIPKLPDAPARYERPRRSRAARMPAAAEY